MMERISRVNATGNTGTQNKKMILVVALLALLPVVFSFTDSADYITYIVVRILILAIFAMSYDLIFGYCGMLSMGHSLFQGTAAYTVAIMMVRLDLGIRDALIPILVAIVLGAFLGWLQGFLSSRLGTLAVFLVTIATAETAFLLVLADPTGITNSENGISGIPRETIFGIINIKPEFNFYYFALGIAVLSFLALRAITRLPFGDTLTAIRENPQRAMYLGYNITQYRIMTFVISGMFASLAGALVALHETSVAAENFGMVESMYPFLFCILGGAGTLVGPVIGTTVMLVFMEIVSDIVHYYIICVALVIIFTVMFLPSGFYSLFEKFNRQKGSGNTG